MDIVTLIGSWVLAIAAMCLGVYCMFEISRLWFCVNSARKARDVLSERIQSLSDELRAVRKWQSDFEAKYAKDYDSLDDMIVAEREWRELLAERVVDLEQRSLRIKAAMEK